MDKNNGTYVSSYKIPDKIKNQIPEYFYYALAGEYISISGKRDALIEDKTGSSLLNYCSSTSGYFEAFRTACKKLSMDWLFEYWKQLSCGESDIFNDEIIEETIKRFDNYIGVSPYYNYLLKSKLGCKKIYNLDKHNEIDGIEEPVICNKCGEKLDFWDKQEGFFINRKLGYGTKYDGDKLNLHLCCNCMEKLIDECKVTPISNL